MVTRATVSRADISVNTGIGYGDQLYPAWPPEGRRGKMTTAVFRAFPHKPSAPTFGAPTCTSHIIEEREKNEKTI